MKINMLSKMKGKLVATGLILTITLLAACSSVGATTSGVISNDANTTLLTACHATGDPANPYENLTVNSAELNVHRGHLNDINPVPANGCPTSPVLISDGKITICHATGSQTNPYNEITVPWIVK